MKSIILFLSAFVTYHCITYAYDITERNAEVFEIVNELEFSLSANVDERPIKGKLWTRYKNGWRILIPYEASNRLKHSRAMMKLITAMDQFETKTCISFVTRVPNEHEDYIFFDVGKKCSTWVGRKGGKQLFQIGGKCVKRKSLLENMLIFTLGFGRAKKNNPSATEMNDFIDDSEFVYNYPGSADERELSPTDVSIVNKAYQCYKPGTEVTPGSIPWQVSLNMRTTGLSFCGGSLINNYWILSAAHCFKYTTNPQYYTGYLGKHRKYEQDDTEIQVFFSQIFKHKGYVSATKVDDIALLKMEDGLTYTAYIKPICLPANPNDVPQSGASLTVSGWGDTLGTGDNSVLLKTTVSLIDWDTCKKYEPNVLGNMLCAGSPNGGKDACTGDSGGPLTYKKDGRYLLVGIVSWGRECGIVNQPGIYTNVGRYLNWINKKLKL